ncbi:MAG: hypothetical protein J7L71_05155, partial [Spirochaetaceae bacterium]|nr:hypothetical protein [Spirochaetaceae bacterium]
IFITVRQVYKYNKVDAEVNSLIMSQRELFEKNKRMVANLSILSSPERIDSLASGMPDLDNGALDTVRIKIEPEDRSNND